MHYRTRHHGDYLKITVGFNMLEHGACTLLYDACYDRERFPTLDEAMQWTGARNEEQKDAVKHVLCHLFKYIDGFYVNDAIKNDLESYKSVCKKNQEIALLREEEKRRQKAEEADKQKNIEHGACTERAHDVHVNHKTIKPLNQDKSPLPPSQGEETKKKKGARMIDAKKVEQGQKEIEAKKLASFDKFWNIWPRTQRRNGKAACLKKWKAQNLDSIVDEIIAHVEAMKKTKPWVEGFEPAPATYLNQQRWTDEVIKDQPVLALQKIEDASTHQSHKIFKSDSNIVIKTDIPQEAKNFMNSFLKKKPMETAKLSDAER